MYSIGYLKSPQPKDRKFEYFSDAVQAAMDAADDGEVWAVWHHRLGDVLAVVFNGEVFTP